MAVVKRSMATYDVVVSEIWSLPRLVNIPRRDLKVISNFCYLYSQ